MIDADFFIPQKADKGEKLLFHPFSGQTNRRSIYTSELQKYWIQYKILHM